MGGGEVRTSTSTSPSSSNPVDMPIATNCSGCLTIGGTPSERLRQYLWAHRDADVNRARRLIELLPADTVLGILRYLVDDYWGRYLGWPDLLLHRDGEFLFVEVKSSSDKLSAEQMRWIIDNHALLLLPFRLAKLHRPSRQTPTRSSRPDAAHN